MWHTNTLWFDVSIVCFIFAVGNMAFGHFESGTPVGDRLAKFILALVIVVTLSSLFGRMIALIFLGFVLVPVFFVHAAKLPHKEKNSVVSESITNLSGFQTWDKKTSAE